MFYRNILGLSLYQFVDSYIINKKQKELKLLQCISLYILLNFSDYSSLYGLL